MLALTQNQSVEVKPVTEGLKAVSMTVADVRLLIGSFLWDCNNSNITKIITKTNFFLTNQKNTKCTNRTFTKIN